MIQVDYNDLDEIKMDLEGIISLLCVLETSDCYKDTSDDGICRALRNSVELTKNKLVDIMDKSNID